MITIITTITTTNIKMIVPQPELNVSKKLSPFFRDNNPIIKAMIIIPNNIDIINLILVLLYVFKM